MDPKSNVYSLEKARKKRDEMAVFRWIMEDKATVQLILKHQQMMLANQPKDSA